MGGRRDPERSKGAEGEKRILKQLSLRAEFYQSPALFLGLIFASRMTSRTHQDCDSSLEITMELWGCTDLGSRGSAIHWLCDLGKGP